MGSYKCNNQDLISFQCLVFLCLGIPTYGAAGALLTLEYFNKENVIGTNMWLTFSALSFVIVIIEIIEIIFLLFKKHKVVDNNIEVEDEE